MVPTLEKIGRYEIVSELGRGAMGLVYRAVDPNIGRTVALKTMRLDVHGMEHDEMLRRFKYEARAAGLMNHANIVTIYDADEVDGLFYIAMEYLEGDTIQSLMIEKRIIPADQIADVGKQVAAGLDYAHAMKVIHRDIKPANIMITRQNVAKIMDFGISKTVGSMTSSGQILGTPNYMSPEQVKGLDLDGRADLFSFGVVLYEMATGERPFGGQNVTTIIYKIINENPIPPCDLEMTVHPGLSAVITRCLEKNPDDRYQTGAELAQDMENYRSIGSEGDVTSVLSANLQARSQAAAQSSGSWRHEVSTARSAGTQAAAARAAKSGAIPNPKTAKQPTRVATPADASSLPKREKQAAVVAAVVLAVIVFAAALFGVKHRQKSLPQPQQSVGSSSAIAHDFTTPQANAKLENKIPVKEVARKSDSSAAEEIPEKGRPSTAARKVEIRFNSKPAGAFVQIDGKSSSAWLTPFRLPDLTPGTHEVVFTKQGYAVETRKLEIGPKNDSYSLELAPVTTALSISSDPPGAGIDVDGRDSGKVTPAQIPVAEGQHRIAVHLDGYHTAQVMANVNRGDVFSFQPVLNPGDARQAGNTNPVTTRLGKIFGGGIKGGKGMIDFVTTPPGAKILINGRAIPIATPAHFPFPPGDYRIELREPGYKPMQQAVHVEAGKISRVSVSLDPK